MVKKEFRSFVGPSTQEVRTSVQHQWSVLKDRHHANIQVGREVPFLSASIIVRCDIFSGQSIASSQTRAWFATSLCF